RGLDFGPAFQQIDIAVRAERSIWARISSDARADAFLFHPAVQDACMHVMALGFSGQRGTAYLPFSINVLRFDKLPGGGQLWSRARVESSSDGPLQDFCATVDVFDVAGAPVLRAEGIQLARIESSPSPTREALENWCYGLDWQDADAKQV